MNFQEKLFETSVELRNRATEFANTTLETARIRADLAAKKVQKLKGSLTVINQAGAELNKVARRHAVRFVKQNSSLAAEARDDVTALARSTFTTLQKGVNAKARKPVARRKRKTKAA